MTGAETLARFGCGLRLEAVPGEVVEAAKLHLLDAIGVGLAASTLPMTSDWIAAARRFGSGTATALGHRERIGGIGAAMLNGSLIHSLEFDDTHVASVVHGSAVAASAALAVAEENAGSGPDLLCGYIAAWEAMIRLGLAAPGAYQANGFQISAIGGAIGAAVAMARIAALNEIEAVSAIGIAGSQASGLLAFLSDGSSVKALHPGWAAHTGVTAGSLASAGMTGPAEILEGKFGFLDSFAREETAAERLERQLADLGTIWHLPETAFKFYPCCHYIHPFLEALEQCAGENDAIAAITCEVPPPMAPLICEPWARRQAPASGYDGKWGLAYCLAAKLVTGSVDVDTFVNEPDPAIVAMARRIDWREMADHDFPERFQAGLTLRLEDGEERSARIDSVFGGMDRPASLQQVVDKFGCNASRVLGSRAVDRLAETILSLESQDSIAILSETLSGGRLT